MSSDSDTYKVVIEGAGLSVTREIDAPTLGRVMQAMLGGGLQPEEADSMVFGDTAASAPPAQKVRPLSAREFLMSSGAKRYPDKIVAIGHYLEEHEGKEGFTKEDIKSRFRAAGEPPPGNFPRDFSVAVSLGWIAEDPVNRGQLYITTSGKEALANNFSGTARPPRRKQTRRRRSAGLIYQPALGR